MRKILVEKTQQHLRALLYVIAEKMLSKMHEKAIDENEAWEH
jgi:hypothetical protein